MVSVVTSVCNSVCHLTCRSPPTPQSDHASPRQEETLFDPGSLWNGAYTPLENEGEHRAGKLFSGIFLLRFTVRVERGKVVYVSMLGSGSTV